MRRALAFLLLVFVVFLGGCHPGNLNTTPTSTQALHKEVSPAPVRASESDWGIGLWKAQGRSWLAAYRGTWEGSKPAFRWEMEKKVALPSATNWDLLPSKGKDQIWMISESDEGWTFWTWDLQTSEMVKMFYLEPNLGAPLFDTTWRPKEGVVVIEDETNSNAPCWRLLNARSGKIRDLVCAQGDNAILYGKDIAFPLGWADEHTLYGLHWGIVTTTPQSALGPNVRPTGQWEIVLLDIHTKQVQLLPLPEMPSSYRQPLATLTAHAYRSKGGEVEFAALASNPNDKECSTFVAVGQWHMGKKGWRAKPYTRCLPYPVSDTFVIDDYRMWIQPAATVPLGYKILIEREGRIVQEITSHSSLHWGYWQGADQPQRGQRGIWFKERDAEGVSVKGLYLFLLPEETTQQIPLPTPPNSASSGGALLDFFVMGQ